MTEQMYRSLNSMVDNIEDEFIRLVNSIDSALTDYEEGREVVLTRVRERAAKLSKLLEFLQRETDT